MESPIMVRILEAQVRPSQRGTPTGSHTLPRAECLRADDTILSGESGLSRTDQLGGASGTGGACPRFRHLTPACCCPTPGPWEDGDGSRGHLTPDRGGSLQSRAVCAGQRNRAVLGERVPVGLGGRTVLPSMGPSPFLVLTPRVFMQHLLCAWPCPAHCFTEEDSHIQAKT